MAHVTDDDLALTVTRVIDAPAAAIYKAWTDPQQIARWIGPRSVRAEVKAMDARVGGAYRIAMEMPDRVMVVGGIYREMTPGERLVFTWAFEGSDGHTPGPQTTVTVSLRPVGDQTEVSIHHARFDTKPNRDGHEQGWTGSLDKLADYLATGIGRA